MKIKKINELNKKVTLLCSKVSHNPYKEELITEIPERVFQIDGYQVAERLLEGIPFSVYFDESGNILDVKINDSYYKKYFEDNYNSKKSKKSFSGYF